jgi:hypothetical protein
MQRVLPSQIYWAQVLAVFALATVALYAPPAERGAQVGLAAACGAVYGPSHEPILGDGGEVRLGGMHAMHAAQVHAAGCKRAAAARRACAVRCRGLARRG